MKRCVCRQAASIVVLVFVYVLPCAELRRLDRRAVEAGLRTHSVKRLTKIPGWTLKTKPSTHRSEIADNDTWPLQQSSAGKPSEVQPSAATLIEFRKLYPRPLVVHQIAGMKNASIFQKVQFFVTALGDGVGVRMQPGPSFLNPLSMYMRAVETVQEIGFVMLAALAYIVVLVVSAVVAYRSTRARSNATFYSDPRVDCLGMHGREVDHFFHTFCQAPKFVPLVVTGMQSVASRVRARQRVAFSFALDVSSWMVRSADALGEDDEKRVSRFVDMDGNPFERLIVKKVLAWQDWEDLALNIKHMIKQKGFSGDVIVQKRPEVSLPIFKNVHWANFLLSYHFRTIVTLSVVGWLFYLPYVWYRSTANELEVRYYVDMPIDQFWQMIESKLNERGFDASTSQEESQSS
eukprot:TRINITY_DN18548_c1_g1_i1.p1 TRINITY_DN18548_c1_g1~~TRINITY_DN18548_c1_g1_i1.p1  ORF type:complete len:435 (+),score=32.07 TRINITY_DN18548_c1_g1_i1:92-1306(+)